MRIELIQEDKKRFLDLLLLADEQESMIDRYLERGDLFALFEDDLRCVCVVTDEGEGVYEIKNIAVEERYQRQGYGKRMIEHVFAYYSGRCQAMLVGTGDSPSAIPFYQQCGFTVSHRVPNFFIDNYDHPMFDAGVQLKDMVYLKKEFAREAPPAQ